MRVLLPIAVVSLMLAPVTLVAQSQPQSQPAPPTVPTPSPRPAPLQLPPAPQPPAPFPEGAKVAFLDFQRIVVESIEGKAASKKVQDLNQKKVTELNDKNKVLQAAQQKLQQELTVLSEPARQRLEKEIERMTVDIQRFTQDAQAEVQELQQALQLEFQRKVLPIVEQVANARGLHMVFSTDTGIVWANRGLDITPEVVQRFDAAAKGEKPSPKPQ